MVCEKKDFEIWKIENFVDAQKQSHDGRELKMGSSNI